VYAALIADRDEMGSKICN